jgi:hypothetical protein
MTKTSATLADLKPATILALSKMLTKKVIDDARDQVAAGDYEIEAVVHLGGDLSVEDDSETLQVNKLQPMLLLKIAMDKLNRVSIESLVAEAIEIMQKQEKIKNKTRDEDEDEEEEADPVMKEFKAATAKAYKKMAKATLQRKRGAVKFEGDISPVEA